MGNCISCVNEDSSVISPPDQPQSSPIQQESLIQEIQKTAPQKEIMVANCYIVRYAIHNDKKLTENDCDDDFIYLIDYPTITTFLNAVDSHIEKIKQTYPNCYIKVMPAKFTSSGSLYGINIVCLDP